MASSTYGPCTSFCFTPFFGTNIFYTVFCWYRARHNGSVESSLLTGLSVSIYRWTETFLSTDHSFLTLKIHAVYLTLFFLCVAYIKLNKTYKNNDYIVPFGKHICAKPLWANINAASLTSLWMSDLCSVL